MENQFFVDSEHLSPEALAKKHRLETDPFSRKNHMEYLPGMEIIESDVCEQVLSQMNSFDYSIYTARDVRAALDHETCSVEDFKALLSPAAEPFLEEMAQKARMETSKHFGNTVYLFTPLYIALRTAFAGKDQDFLHTGVSNDFHFMLNLLHIQLHAVDMVVAVEAAVDAVILAIVGNVQGCE